MKILFILEYYYPNIGGVEKLFKDLAESLAAKGNEILIITSRFDNTLPREEVINKVSIKRLNLSNRFLFTFFSVLRIIKLAKNYDVIHTTSYNAAFPAWIAAKILRKKSIITFHEVWGNLWKDLPYLSNLQKTLFSSYEAFILKLKFDKYIAVSDFTKLKLIETGIPEKKVTRIYNGINIEDYDASDINKNIPFTFTYFGRLGVSKGLDILIPAAKNFTKLHPETIFKCIIPTVPRKLYLQIMKEIEDLSFGSNIELFHNLSFSKLRSVIQESTCVMIPSYSEGFCFAAVEAIALNVPIISSGKGALRETVSGKNIVMEQFSQEGLLASLEKAYCDNFDFVAKKEFSLEKSVENYMLFYNSLTNN